MLCPKKFTDVLKELGITFFSGVPDSLLKDFGAYVMDSIPSSKHIISANEGSAVAIATGHYLATKNMGLVYLQNSGLGNTINPLMSLADPEVYSIPMILLIGWRGEPGVKDEPQHNKQGEVTESSLNALGIPYEILSSDEDISFDQLKKLADLALQESRPVALIVRKGTFKKYSLQKKIENKYDLSREEAIDEVLKTIPSNSAIVATTGKTSRELFELRVKYCQGHEKDFLTVGSMGHANQIAMAIASERKSTPVYCLDGDGAFIMHMGGGTLASSLNLKNFTHIILNNGAHESVGGQPTCSFSINLDFISKGLGYSAYFRCESKDEIKKALDCTTDGSKFIEILIKVGSREDLGRPTRTPLENKGSFMEYLRNDL